MVISNINITIAGSGYVGMSLAVLLAQTHKITIYDIDQKKVDKINSGTATIEGKDIDKYFDENKSNISATSDSKKAFLNAEIVIIATPTDYNEKSKEFDVSTVDIVLKQINRINKNTFVAIKSTVPVGFTQERKKLFPDLELIFSPEFLKEGNSLHDNLYPSRIIIGGKSKRANLFGIILDNASHSNENKILYMSSTEAEAVKLFSNTYLAMRVAFFNELDTFAYENRLDTKSIITGVSADKRIGDYYNNPSFGYGGYCLPKDTKQLLKNFNNIPQTLIAATINSNTKRKEFIAEKIYQIEKSKIGIYRLLMKKNSVNFRSSAIIDIMNILYKKGVQISIYEPHLEDFNEFKEFKVICDYNEFKSINNLIITNRFYKELEDIRNIVFTRDIFNSN
jgi:UDPglucose 6-dehydrogenase